MDFSLFAQFFFLKRLVQAQKPAMPWGFVLPCCRVSCAATRRVVNQRVSNTVKLGGRVSEWFVFVWFGCGLPNWVPLNNDRHIEIYCWMSLKTCGPPNLELVVGVFLLGDVMWLKTCFSFKALLGQTAHLNMVDVCTILELYHVFIQLPHLTRAGKGNTTLDKAMGLLGKPWESRSKWWECWDSLALISGVNFPPRSF